MTTTDDFSDTLERATELNDQILKENSGLSNGLSVDQIADRAKIISALIEELLSLVEKLVGKLVKPSDPPAAPSNGKPRRRLHRGL